MCNPWSAIWCVDHKACMQLSLRAAPSLRSGVTKLSVPLNSWKAERHRLHFHQQTFHEISEKFKASACREFFFLTWRFCWQSACVLVSHFELKYTVRLQVMCLSCSLRLMLELLKQVKLFKQKLLLLSQLVLVSEILYLCQAASKEKLPSHRGPP